MGDEANRCWCGSILKDKPHNCIGTRGRVEELLAENAKLRAQAQGASDAHREAVASNDKLIRERDSLVLLISDWLQHECSVGGPSWEEIERRARAILGEKQVIISPMPPSKCKCTESFNRNGVCTRCGWPV